VRPSLVSATIVAGLVAICGWTMAQQPGGPPSTGRPPSSPVAAPGPVGTSVVVIDIAYIFKNHVRFNAAINDMKRDIQQYEAAAQEEAKKINAKAERLTQFNAGTADFKKLEEEVARDKSELQIKAGLKRKEFMEQEAKLYYQTYREIEQMVTVFAQRNRINLVLRYTPDEMKPDDRNSVLQGVNRAVVFQQNLDITELILQQLNPAGAAAPGSTTAPIVPGTQNARPPAAPPRTGAPIQR
jgi:Skp family chaperone for outer membrane proteins